MDFIERIFDISPDLGSGLFEWLLLPMPFVAFTVITLPYFVALKSRIRKKCTTLRQVKLDAVS
jgi:hypothetical protein